MTIKLSIYSLEMERIGKAISVILKIQDDPQTFDEMTQAAYAEMQEYYDRHEQARILCFADDFRIALVKHGIHTQHAILNADMLARCIDDLLVSIQWRVYHPISSCLITRIIGLQWVLPRENPGQGLGSTRYYCERRDFRSLKSYNSDETRSLLMSIFPESFGEKGGVL